MSALRDLLTIEQALESRSGQGMRKIEKYLLKRIRELEGGDKKKKEEEKKGKWSLEDRICLGLILAFTGIPIGGAYLYFLHTIFK